MDMTLWRRALTRVKQGLLAAYWNNPTPANVVLVPVTSKSGREGVLAVVRSSAISYPGLVALPGGYHDMGETSREGACREVYEETRVRIYPHELRLRDVVSSQDKARVVVLWECTHPVCESEVDLTHTDRETAQVKILWSLPSESEVAFAPHYKLMKEQLKSDVLYITEFTFTPGARTRKEDPNFSGQEFLEDYLAPALDKAIHAGTRLTVDVDCAGMATSFIEGSFGELARQRGGEVLDLISVRTSDSLLVDEIYEIMRAVAHGKHLD